MSCISLFLWASLWPLLSTLQYHMPFTSGTKIAYSLRSCLVSRTLCPLFCHPPRLYPDPNVLYNLTPLCPVSNILCLCMPNTQYFSHVLCAHTCLSVRYSNAYLCLFPLFTNSPSWPLLCPFWRHRVSSKSFTILLWDLSKISWMNNPVVLTEENVILCRSCFMQLEARK